MVTRIERLLLVCAVCFVVVLVAINDYALSYMRIIREFDISGTVINFACMDFWSPYLVQTGAEIRVSIADVDTDSLLSQNWPSSTLVRHGS